MSKAYNDNGVQTPSFRDNSVAAGIEVRKAVNQLMALGYSGVEVSYFLNGEIQLTVASNNIRNALAVQLQQTLSPDKPFLNGLPNDGEVVEVKTVWSDDWERMFFRGRVSNSLPKKGNYGWFGAYADPSLDSKPIVMQWRYPQ
jgi:hypothetical protein